MNIDLLTVNREEEYEQLLLSCPRTSIYSSIQYRDVLTKILDDATPLYIIATQNNHIVGALPAFLKKTVKHGCVLNSLPFNGSNGGVIVDPNVTDKLKIKKTLINEFNSLAEQYDVRASTLITNPLDPDVEIYEKNTNYTHLDQRYGQVTFIPEVKTNDLPEALMGLLHQKTRDMVRKGIRNEFTITSDLNDLGFEWLFETHRENMLIIGGLSKPKVVFEAIRNTLNYEKEYKIYVTRKGTEIAGALLVMYYNNTTEYYTPAVSSKYRNEQVLSAIIFHAMLESASRGRLQWNWGGTWLSQESVYHFKKRWGTKDMPYFYYTKVFDNDILNSKSSEIREIFHFLFVSFSSWWVNIQ